MKINEKPLEKPLENIKNVQKQGLKRAQNVFESCFSHVRNDSWKISADLGRFYTLEPLVVA